MNLKLKKLNESVVQIESGNKKKAEENLTDLLENLLNPDSELDLKYQIFASALLKQTNNDCRAKNIYLRDFEGLSQIDVFDLISTQFPIISLSHKIANDLICEITKYRSSIDLLDIGIGKAAQLEKLIKNLDKKHLKTRFKIIGVDPDPENINEAKQRLLNAAESHQVDLEFIGIPKLVEDLTEKEWLNLAASSHNLVVNGAFALHHTDSKKRQEIIQKISNLNPKAVIISEPDSNHNTSDFHERFNNAWKHFDLVFDMIDRSKINKLQAYLLKECFLGREIEDILGNKESLRSERHESTLNWLRRFYKEEFKAFTPLNFTAKNNVDVPLLEVNNKKEYVGLEYKNINLASILCFTK